MCLVALQVTSIKIIELGLSYNPTKANILPCLICTLAGPKCITGYLLWYLQSSVDNITRDLNDEVANKQRAEGREAQLQRQVANLEVGIGDLHVHLQCVISFSNTLTGYLKVVYQQRAVNIISDRHKRFLLQVTLQSTHFYLM